MLKQIKQALLLFVALSILTGVVYPLVITGLAQLIFPRQANGSLIYRDGRAVGSELIGQSFTDPKHFWSRPSATTPFPYNAAASNGSNLGPLNPDLEKSVSERIAELRKHDSTISTVPIDLVTASASGLDPHISPAAAEAQVRRVAAAWKMPEDELRELVGRHVEPPQLGFLGEPRVNVLQLNLALEARGRGNSPGNR